MATDCILELLAFPSVEARRFPVVFPGLSRLSLAGGLCRGYTRRVARNGRGLTRGMTGCMIP